MMNIYTLDDSKSKGRQYLFSYLSKCISYDMRYNKLLDEFVDNNHEYIDYISVRALNDIIHLNDSIYANDIMRLIHEEYTKLAEIPNNYSGIMGFLHRCVRNIYLLILIREGLFRKELGDIIVFYFNRTSLQDVKYLFGNNNVLSQGKLNRGFKYALDNFGDSLQVKMVYKDYFTIDTLSVMNSIINQVRPSNIKSYIKKARLMGEIDSERYMGAVFIEFMTPIIKLATTDENYVTTLDKRKLRGLLDIADKYGAISSQFNDTLDKLSKKENRAKVAEIRRRYKYITPLIMSDKEILIKSNIELADINYKLKTGGKI